MKTRMYPRVDAFEWHDTKLENGSWDNRALAIYKEDGLFKATFNRFFNGSISTRESRIIRTLSEAQFERAKQLLYTLYVKSESDRECELAAEHIDWFCKGVCPNGI